MEILRCGVSQSDLLTEECLLFTIFKTMSHPNFSVGVHSTPSGGSKGGGEQPETSIF